MKLNEKENRKQFKNSTISKADLKNQLDSQGKTREDPNN